MTTPQPFEGPLHHLDEELAQVRTGRASPSLIEHLKVEHYGTTMELQALASISAPEPRLLLVQPWDTAALASIERALQSSAQGYNPMNDGTSLRVPLPTLTAERRVQLTKVVTEMGERAKIAVRSLREDAVKAIRADERSGQKSEDEGQRSLEALQDDVDRANEAIKAACAAKISDIQAP